jgi:ABC-2 type transport system permease protein
MSTRRVRNSGAADALQAEWTKAPTLASTGWLLLAPVTLAVTVSAAAASLLYLFPIIGTALGGSHLARLLQQIGPMTAGLAIQATTGLRNLPISPWAGLGVLAAWAAAALLAGGLLLRLRDA